MIVLMLTTALLATQSAATTPSPCGLAMASAVGTVSAELCLAEQETKLGDAARQGEEQSRHWRLAQSHYRRSADSATDVEAKKRALTALIDLFGPKRLDDLAQTEAVVRELIALDPNEVEPLFRLSKLLEDRLLFDAAEDLLLAAHHQAPFAIEPYRMLAQFFARRATAVYQFDRAQSGTPQPPPPGEPDDHGVYRVGGPIRAPHKVDNPVYPPAALVAGIEGVVAAEIVVNPAGEVVDAKVIRSIPLLDEAALKAVRNWRYESTIVNGQAVPVRMSVTVNFTKPRER